MNPVQTKIAKIRELNDNLRRTLLGGQIVVTLGVSSLGEAQRAAVLAAVMEFEAFTEANDPREEHDFGAIEVAGQTIFWKIDYYDPELKFLSRDPSNPDLTRRVLTVMLASEY